MDIGKLSLDSIDPSICSALGLFSWDKDRARTRVGEIKHRVSARKMEGVLFMPDLRFLLPLLILCCCRAGEISGSLGCGGGDVVIPGGGGSRGAGVSFRHSLGAGSPV